MNTTHRFDTDDRRWEASRARDPAAAHAFYICVRTTGIYCISTCAGRPLRKNVFFIGTRAEAEKAGMRACKRCKPDSAEAHPIRARVAPARIPGANAARGSKPPARKSV